MSENEFTESIEPADITDSDIHDFMDGGKLPSFHAVLQVWQEILKPAEDELNAKVTPQWANRIIQSYPQITYADMVAYRDSYFGKILELSKILDFEISTDDECFNASSPEEDAEFNSHHYKNLLVQWQLAILQWELDWDTEDKHAAVELAAISEVHKMFFGDTGITAFLDNIKFEFNEDDQATLSEALQELKEGQ